METASNCLDQFLDVGKLVIGCLYYSLVVVINCLCYLVCFKFRKSGKKSENSELTANNQNTLYCEVQTQLTSTSDTKYHLPKGIINSHNGREGTLVNNCEIKCNSKIISSINSKEQPDDDKNLSNQNNSIGRKPNLYKPNPHLSSFNKPAASASTLFNAKEKPKITEKKLSKQTITKSDSNEASKIIEEKKSPLLLVKQETEKVLSPKIQYFALYLNHPGYKNSTFSDDSYDLLKPKCSKCQQQDKKILGFLCNHNLCEDCTSLHCAYYILNFLNEYKLNPNKSFQFCYSCPINECGLKISFPTALLLKRVRGWLKDPWFRQNYSCFVFFEESTMDLWVPYFDGIFS